MSRSRCSQFAWGENQGKIPLKRLPLGLSLVLSLVPSLVLSLVRPSLVSPSRFLRSSFETLFEASRSRDAVDGNGDARHQLVDSITEERVYLQLATANKNCLQRQH